MKRRAILVMMALGCLGSGCIHVENPVLQAQSMEFTSVAANGVTFRVVFNAYNPNGFELVLRDLDARLFLENNDVGSSVTSLGATLPPARWVPITSNVTVPWNGVPAYLIAGMGAPTVNYTLQGTVAVEHSPFSIHVNFTTGGVVQRDFFMRGALGNITNAINSVLPGLGGMVQ